MPSSLSGGLFDAIESQRRQRRTGLLECEVQGQRRSLPLIGGELHLLSSHPFAAKWRELLARPSDAHRARAMELLLGQLVDGLIDWGNVKGLQFEEGHARIPADLVGPLPTARLVRMAASRSPRAPQSVEAKFGRQRLVTDAGASASSGVWTPEELWVLERLRQPTALPDLIGHSPIPRDALLRAIAGLAASGRVRVEGGATSSSRADELSEVAATIGERIATSLDRDPLDVAGSGDFRQRIQMMLANSGGLDHYELLGIDSDAEDSELQTAFEELARLVHPSNARRLGAPELADALTYLFEGAIDAYQTLSDPARRFEYRKALQLPTGPAVEIDPVEREREVKTMARRQFDRARSEERNGDYQTALVLYEEVTRIDPSVEHWTALARLQERNPSWTHRAIESWRAALALDPQNGPIRQALGELYEKAGDTDQALRCYQAAASGATPLAAAAAAAERLRSAKGISRESGARGLGRLFRRS